MGCAATRGVGGDDWNERVIAVRVCKEDGVRCERGGVGDEVDVVRSEKYAGRLALLRFGFELMVVSWSTSCSLEGSLAKLLLSCRGRPCKPVERVEVEVRGMSEKSSSAGE